MRIPDTVNWNPRFWGWFSWHSPSGKMWLTMRGPFVWWGFNAEMTSLTVARLMSTRTAKR